MRKLFLLFCLLTASATQAKECLEIALRENNDRLVLEAANGSAKPGRSARAIAKDFRAIYQAVEGQKKLNAGTDALIDKLSQELLAPLTSQIQRASCVVFQINQSQKYYMLDLLSINNQPLFLEKPVGFAFKKNADFAIRLSQSARGLILRDPDADPQNGTGKAGEIFPGSKFKLMKQTNTGIFSGSVDFLLVSGHGSVSMPWDDEDEEDDSIGFNDEELTPEIFGRAKHKLAYLDSCQLGVSQSFINASRKAGSNYYMAPVISNEAGNSSTLTISYFFAALREGQLPIIALHNTRKRIYNEFKGRASRERLLYYAYPFRLYAL
ncbi:MAG: hypothetical protein JNM27_22715 [Leptospirales bacterium]|nr:hypothetical protein [Leptospirales bacterium]